MYHFILIYANLNKRFVNSKKKLTQFSTFFEFFVLYSFRRNRLYVMQHKADRKKYSNVNIFAKTHHAQTTILQKYVRKVLPHSTLHN